MKKLILSILMMLIPVFCYAGSITISGGAGGGDMTASVYDAAGIAEQVVGLTATQTLTNKTITGTFTGALTGQASTVATIAGLAPNTATTQAVQASITTAVNLSITASQVSDFDTEVANNSAVTLNTGKDTNVSTNLSEGTSTTTTVDVNSSDGTNATLVSASTSRAGLLTKAKFDEIVVNTAKVIPTDFDPAGTDNSDDNATNTLYSGLVTESTTVSAPLIKTTYALSIPQATTGVSGYVTNSDWNAFNNKVSEATSIGTANGLSLSTYALSMAAASTTVVGTVELAIGSEVDTGTSATLAVTPDGFQASKRNIRWLAFNLVEAGTDNTAADNNIGGDFISPIAGTILQSDTTPFYLYATNSTAGTTGTMVVDISLGGTSIMTTNKLDFDTTEKTTTTAATPPDLTDTTIAVGDIITIDIDSIHDGTAAKGLTVYMGILED